MKNKKLDFSKKIVVWAMWLTTIFLIITIVGFYKTGEVPEELVNMVSLIVSGIIISYAGKSGVENYQKIKNNNITCESQSQNGGITNG